MNFELSEEQQAIADLASNLFAGYSSDEALNLFDAQDAPFMHGLWSDCVDAGLHVLALPEAYGGSGLGMTELMLVLQAQGGALAQVPLWRHQLAAAALAKFAGDHSAEVLQAAAQGQVLLTLDAGSHARDQRLLARKTDGHWQLDGQVQALPLGVNAGYALVSVNIDAGSRLALLDIHADGIGKTPGRLCNGEPVADLLVRNVRLPEAALLPAAALDWLETRAIAALAALQLGVSVEQVRRTVEYVNERRQFGRVIASFQAVQMTLADTKIAIEALRSSLWQLVYRLDAGLPATAEARATRYLACEAGHLVGHKAQHVHGGVGVDLSYPIHRYLYWSRALGITLGGAAPSLAHLGDWLAEHDTLGWKYDLDEHPILC